ncbi:MAG TPA: hypothetical protein VI757_00205 [Bacteroidia bacterium]|nr:hypothetical protein [Bacteroidia bacterium]
MYDTIEYPISRWDGLQQDLIRSIILPEKFKQHRYEQNCENYFPDKPKVFIQIVKNIFNAAIHFMHGCYRLI